MSNKKQLSEVSIRTIVAKISEGHDIKKVAKFMKCSDNNVRCIVNATRHNEITLLTENEKCGVAYIKANKEFFTSSNYINDDENSELVSCYLESKEDIEQRIAIARKKIDNPTEEPTEEPTKVIKSDDSNKWNTILLDLDVSIEHAQEHLNKLLDAKQAIVNVIEFL